MVCEAPFRDNGDVDVFWWFWCVPLCSCDCHPVVSVGGMLGEPEHVALETSEGKVLMYGNQYVHGKMDFVKMDILHNVALGMGNSTC